MRINKNVSSGTDLPDAKGSLQSLSSEMVELMTATFPIMMGYVPLGIIFGFLLCQQGMSWWIAPFMSLFIFAGAAQFLVLGLLAAGASVLEMTIACMIVNLRHIFYGISVKDLLPKSVLGRQYCIFALTDENYSLLTGLDKDYVKKHVVRICAINHAYWTIAAAVGAILGEVAKINVPGLEFSLVALFTVLAVEQFRRLRRPVFPIIAVCSYIAASYFAGDQALFASICVAIFFCLIVTTQFTGHTPKPETRHDA